MLPQRTSTLWSINTTRLSLAKTCLKISISAFLSICKKKTESSGKASTSLFNCAASVWAEIRNANLKILFIADKGFIHDFTKVYMMSWNLLLQTSQLNLSTNIFLAPSLNFGKRPSFISLIICSAKSNAEEPSGNA